MKKLTLVLIGMTLLISTAFGTHFKDVQESAWYTEWVKGIEELDIASGYPDGTFRPQDKIKRIELLSMTLKALGYQLPKASNYWGQHIIDKALELKIISHQSMDLMYSDPEGFITREETARVIYNAYLRDNDAFDFQVQLKSQNKITDFEEVDGFHRDGVIGVIACGIAKGYDDKSFKPKSHLTRAEAAVFISRLVIPEKRNQDSLDLAFYKYDSQSQNSESFTVDYLPKDQDIINIMFIVDEIENSDTSIGFADIGVNKNKYLIDFYSNQKDFDYSKTRELSMYKRWSMVLPKGKSNTENEDWIELIGYRKESQEEHLSVLNTLFDYLFAEDAKRIWDEFVSLESITVKEDVSNIFDSVSFGRRIKIIADEMTVKLMITRKEDALPITLSDDGSSLIIHYTSLSSNDQTRENKSIP